jgi:hypothetical protein
MPRPTLLSHLHALKARFDEMLAREGPDGPAGDLSACFRFLPTRAMMRTGWTSPAGDSRKGVMDGKAQILDLRERIVLKSADYEARLSEVRVDMAKGDVTSDKPVSVTFKNGTLDAQRLEILDSGAFVRFTGGVHMNLKADDPAPSPAETPVAGAR